MSVPSAICGACRVELVRDQPHSCPDTERSTDAAFAARRIDALYRVIAAQSVLERAARAALDPAADVSSALFVIEALASALADVDSARARASAIEAMAKAPGGQHG